MNRHSDYRSLATPGKSALLLDMDGVLYHGTRPLPGAARFLQRISPLPHLFITNNPIRSPEEVARRLAAMGLGEVTPERILTSAEATARYLHSQHPGFRYFAVGGPGLHQALAAVGRADEHQADYVVVGEGPGLDYQTLTQGLALLTAGARLVVTNPDATVDDWADGRHRLLPGGGALVAPFEKASGQSALVIGKPEPLLFEMAVERLGVALHECWMVGDRPDTDIAGAAVLGIKTALVRTGRFQPGDPWPAELPRPDLDCLDLYELMDVLETVGVLPS